MSSASTMHGETSPMASGWAGEATSNRAKISVLPLSEVWPAAAFAGILAVTPAVSVPRAGWSEHLEPVPWIALVGVIAGFVLARSGTQPLVGHLTGLLAGLVMVTLQYAWLLPASPGLERLGAFISRVSAWLAAAFSGAAGTDNLLFAYLMGVLAWLIGYGGTWFAFRLLNPWWAIVPSGAALLLHLSYAPPELLPWVFVHLVSSVVLLLAFSTASRRAFWRSQAVEFGLNHGAGYTLTGVAVGIAIIFVSWRLPPGEVNPRVASVWENVAGPWQGVQSTFDRLFASLNPLGLSGRGLTVAQAMVPRGPFELGTEPVMRISGREPAYWRAATYDQYTGRAMTSSAPTSKRLNRREPLDGSLASDEGRRYVEYGVTILAPSTSVIYAPDAPLTVSVPTVFEYRSEVRDFSLLRPVVPIREQQRYSVLAAVSTASAAELRQADSIYPSWTRQYLELPPTLPDGVRQESWRVVGDSTNAYDAAARIEQHLRGFTYSTRVPVPPKDRDWVDYLLFEAKEGYCDYYATAMAVMLRSIGIPARVASGYVTGDWDSSTQSYLVTEANAHSWTEVHFPGYGWITFEPSANRPVPARPENPLTLPSEEQLARGLEPDSTLEDFLDEDELLDGGSFVPLPTNHAQPISPVLVIVFAFGVLVFATPVITALLWFRGMSRLPLFARPYAQVVRLASWSGLAPSRAQTPYEYTAHLARIVPAAEGPLTAIVEAHVAGTYGGKHYDRGAIRELRSAGDEAMRILFPSLAAARWRGLVSERLGELAGVGQRA